MKNFGFGLVSSLVNWGLQEASNAISHNRNKKTAKEFMSLENQYLRGNMDYQNQMNINNYNQFESPSAQRRLLTEAGYNPMLAQNSFTGSVGSASASAPHQSAPQTSPTQIQPFELAENYMSLKSMKLHLKNQELQNQQLQVNIDNTRKDTEKKDSEIYASNVMLSLQEKIASGQIDINELDKQLRTIQIRSQDSATQKQIFEDTLQIFKITEEMSYYNDNPQVYRTILETQTNLLISDLKSKDLFTKLTNQQIAKLNAEIQTILLQNKVTEADTKAYIDWFDKLTDEEKKQVTEAKNNLMTNYGKYYTTQQIETLIHKGYYFFDQKEKNRRFILDTTLGTIDAACNVGKTVSSFLKPIG